MIDCDLDDETIRDCLRVAAKRAALECMATIRALHPEIIVDDWLFKYAEKRAFEMDCEKYGVSNG